MGESESRHRWRGVASAALSGLLFALAFPPVAAAPLGFVALVPLFAHVRMTRGRDTALPFLAFGAVGLGIGLYWIRTVLTPFGAIGLAALVSFLYLWPAGLVLGRLVRRGAPFVPTAALVFTVFEWLRSWVYTGFPWLCLGHTQAGTAGFPSLVNAADLLGTWGVTFVLAFANAGFAEFAARAFEDGRFRHRIVAIGLAPALLFTVYGAVRLHTVRTKPGPRVLLVQGNVPQYLKREPRSADELLGLHLNLTLRTVTAEPSVQVVVWPETVFPFQTTDEPGPRAESHRRLSARKMRMIGAAATGRPVLFGSLHTTADGEMRNSVYLLDSAGRPVGRYDKLHAVPGGEYIPLHTVAPKGLVDEVKRLLRLYAGFVPELTEGEEMILFEIGDLRWGPLVCFDLAYPEIPREAVRMGADVLVNLTNYGWWPETSQPEQATQFAVFRAVENRRPVVVSANTGITCVVSPTGVVDPLLVEGRAMDVRGVKTATVPLSRAGSPYVVWGDLPWAAAALLLLAWLLAPLAGRIRSRNRPDGSKML